MPAKELTDAFVRTLSWTKAVQAVEKSHKQRHDKRSQKFKRDGKPELPFEPLKPPLQITYLHKLERGLSLTLVLGFGGTKRFRALTYRNGKPQSRKLGTYPQMSVKEARAKAREYFENPQKVEDAAAVGSFKEIAENWFKRHVEAKALISAPEIKRQLTAYVYPRWQDQRFLDIRRKNVSDLLDHIADHHGRAQADAVLATLRNIMGWHQRRDENYVSPIVKGMGRNTSKMARERTLNDNEIRRVWQAAGECGNALLGRRPS